MFNIIRKKIEWAGKPLTIETGKIARQADGAVMINYGNTTLLCTAVAQKSAKEGIDFFPLTVNYQEKAFAAGKIPGGFFKREGRPSEKETLTSRLIDRPIRPLFPDNFYNETQVICTVLSYDGENDPDVVAMVGASAALAISGIPFNGPVGGARVALIDGEFVLNPTIQELKPSQLDLVVAGTRDSVMMVESEAKELTEEQMLDAVVFGHKGMQPVIDLIEELAKECGKPRWEVTKQDTADIESKIAALAEDRIRKAYDITLKQERSDTLSVIREETAAALLEENEELESNLISSLIKKLEKKVVRGAALKDKKRIDGRGPEDIRPIETEVEILPQTHGSALFTRGETQALAVTTLGTGQDEQRIDSLEGDSTEHFLLHYNFPPFCVGEASFLKSPGRREIGHGKLAWRSLRAVLPNKEEFPYTIRIVSEVTESNGSSSMATVCGSSLSLMDAGVPITAPVAGIAMGLIKEEKDFIVLSDIMGDEDHLGDMDFKVAGTEKGVTALQMDIKIDGITKEIMQVALNQANAGRKHILDKMKETLSTARDDVNEYAPKITTITIPEEKIREVIGSGGATIREICATSNTKIDIEDDGTIRIAATKSEDANKAVSMIQDIVADVEVGKIYHDCEVVKVVDFGAFVAIIGKHQGLVHISELAPQRVSQVTDIINEGDLVKVKVLGIDRGKIRLSMKAVDQETGEDLSDQYPPSAAPSSKPRPNKKGLR